MTPVTTMVSLSSHSSSQEDSAGAGPDDERARYAQGRRAAVLSVVLNLLLASAKFALALLTHSIALMADAAHTASDMLTSIAVWIGLRVARRPADPQHPYGHGRAETIAALVVAVFLGAAGIEFAWESVARIVNPPEVGGRIAGWGLLLAAGFIALTIVVKAWMGFYAARVGRRINNPSLLADAWHHHSDALSSVLVVVALVLAKWEVYGADAWLGLGVSLVILYAAWHHLRHSSSSLLGERPDSRLLGAIESTARAVHGVKDVHEVVVHDYGRRKMASLHITLLSGLALADAHRVATEVEGRIASRLNITGLVHAEPEGDAVTVEHVATVRDAVRRALSRHPGIVSFHALSIQPEDHGLEVEFHVHIPPGTPIEVAHRLEHDVTALLEREFPQLHIHLHVEPCGIGCVPCPESCGSGRPEPSGT